MLFISVLFNASLLCLIILALHKKKKRKKLGASAKSQNYYRPESSCQIGELADLYTIFLGERDKGLVVEVGAYDGISWSNSSCLIERGWNAILIEPVPQYAQLCKQRYKDNSKVVIEESAIGETEGYVNINVAQALSTTSSKMLDSYQHLEWSKNHVGHYSSVMVKRKTLDTLLEERNVSKLDVLIVDVEGAESEVFSGFSIQRWKPSIMIVELGQTHPDLHAHCESDTLIQRNIANAGYQVIYKDKINTVFATLSTPTNL